jgi:hypothetical protein
VSARKLSVSGQPDKNGLFDSCSHCLLQWFQSRWFTVLKFTVPKSGSFAQVLIQQKFHWQTRAGRMPIRSTREHQKLGGFNATRNYQHHG